MKKKKNGGKEKGNHLKGEVEKKDGGKNATPRSRPEEAVAARPRPQGGGKGWGKLGQESS